LIEVAIAVALFSVVTLVVWNIVGRTGRAVRTGFTAAEIDTTLRRAVDRVQEDLRVSGSAGDGTDHVSSHPITSLTSAAAITFRKRTGVEDTEWGAPITYGLGTSLGEVADNGVDDDGDGVVDERTLVRSQGTEAIVIADNLTAAVFTRPRGEYRVDIRFTVARFVPDDNALASRTVNSTVALRNKP